MYNYCTLFDTTYLTRGLAMYESLSKYATDFHLYVFAFDDKSYDILRQLHLPNMTVISLRQFEDKELLAVKPTRSVGEYCWTCTPSVIKYCLDNYDINNCTYVDADILFFADPSILIEEMGDNSVLITEHRYTPKYDQTQTSGIYCVQFMTFKRDERALNVLQWWRDACIDWCYARFEDGKFGDQKYLDDWTTRFEGIHVLHHLGGGVAPWNVQQYDLNRVDFELIFYHFHGVKFIEPDKVSLGNYDLMTSDLEKLYKPYIRWLQNITTNLNKKGYQGNFNGFSPTLKLLDNPLDFLKRKLKPCVHIYSIKDFGDC